MLAIDFFPHGLAIFYNTVNVFAVDPDHNLTP